MILAAAALAGIAAIVLAQDRGNKRLRSARMATIAVLGFAAVFTILFGLGRLATRFGPGQELDLRGALARTTFETALKSLPAGTGLGSFVPVYAAVEKTADMAQGYANRAHNDLAEILLETGLVGALLLLAFLVWLAWRARAVWLGSHHAGPAQAMLEKSAALAIALLLAHSLVDYPLRTGALSAMFAFFCAILAAPASAPKNQASHRGRQDIRTLDLQPADIAAPREKWGGQIQWPESWQPPEK